jgi:uncharacterized protein YozE (UPF0346 family)
LQKSFYHFILKYRGGKKEDDFGHLAEEIFYDHSFPKQSNDYDEISSYVELRGYFLGASAAFDQMWERYVIEEKL